MSPSTSSKFGWSARSSPERASRWRLSYAITVFRSTSSRASVVPMKPAPPLMKIRLPSSIRRRVASRRGRTARRLARGGGSRCAVAARAQAADRAGGARGDRATPPGRDVTLHAPPRARHLRRVRAPEAPGRLGRVGGRPAGGRRAPAQPRGGGRHGRAPDRDPLVPRALRRRAARPRRRLRVRRARLPRRPRRDRGAGARRGRPRVHRGAGPAQRAGRPARPALRRPGVRRRDRHLDARARGPRQHAVRPRRGGGRHARRGAARAATRREAAAR